MYVFEIYVFTFILFIDVECFMDYQLVLGMFLRYLIRLSASVTALYADKCW